MRLPKVVLLLVVFAFSTFSLDAQLRTNRNRVSLKERLRDTRIDIATGLMTSPLSDISQYSKTKNNLQIVFGIDPRVDAKFPTGWSYGVSIKYLSLAPSSSIYYFALDEENSTDYYTLEYGNMQMFTYGVYYGYEMLVNKGFKFAPRIGFNQSLISRPVTLNDPSSSYDGFVFDEGGFYFDANLGFEARMSLSSGFGFFLDYAYHYLIETAGNGDVTFGRSLRYYDMTVGIYFNLGPDTW